MRAIDLDGAGAPARAPGHPRLHREIKVSPALIAASRCGPEEAVRRAGGSDAGLDEEEALLRLRRFGANRIAQEHRTGIFYELVNRTKNRSTAGLLTLAVVSYFLGDARAAVVISTMVILSIVTAFIQEHRSNQAAAKLRALVKTTASVKRRGGEPRASKMEGFVEIPMEEIVPGDIVVLSAGDIIPADLRLLAAKDLYRQPVGAHRRVDAVEKARRRCDTGRQGAIDLPNACFQGSNVLSAARPAAWSCNRRPHLLRRDLPRSSPGQRVLTSFDQGINGFTWLMIRFMVVMVADGLPHRRPHQAQLGRGAALRRSSVAVGLTPEMLPMIVTVNLSKGALAMSRKKVIVKRLNAIQNFGAMDVLCTDKTGTLTQDRIVLETLRRRDRPRERGRAALRLHEQLLPDRAAEPARPRHPRARRAHDAAEPQLPQGRRNPLRLPAPAHVGGRRLRGRPRRSSARARSRRSSASAAATRSTRTSTRSIDVISRPTRGRVRTT